MQKHITIDMLSHKVVKNKDIAQKYYIKDHHAPIIRREMWEQVQALLNKNSINAPQTKKRDRFALLSNLYCGVCGKPYRRDHYTSKVLSMCTDDTVCKFGHPIWKCEVNCKTDSSLPRLKHGSKRCDSEYLHECSIFQSFMEKLYQIRNELYVYDEEALIVRDFYSSCMERAKNNNSFFYIDYCECDRQIKRVKNSIMEFAENQEELFEALGEEDFFDSLIVEYEAQLRELEKHKKELFYKLISSDMYYDRFRYFVDSVLTLPEIDPSEDVLIPFDKAFYLSFIESGRVLGDRISYKTKFGTSFDTVGNTRIMEEFISYQKECPDGNRITIKEAYQVYDYQLQYTKRKTG